MIDEVIDKILEINKKVKVVDDLAGIDAEFDQLDKDPYARDELEKELKNNIRVDVLKRRREKQDNSKYTQYAGLKNFKLDFENAIKEAVDDVIETIKSYKEIDPYSEGEDIITKADVKQLIPDEKIPIIALFFDQSGSWPKHYANLGKKAISTLVTDYEQQGLIELHIYYFDDDVTQDENDPSLRNGTTEA
ncbi:MAG: hypothetical protein J6Z11_10265 [Candidatus Riflebacteria bacterium]|nr:hypothetical protein [Candidatus Riflebacteria bacterium]